MNILLTAPYNEKEIKILKSIFDANIVYHSWKPNGRAYNPEEVIRLLSASKADAYIAEHDRITREVIESYSRLKFIGVCRGTPSNADISTASAHQIPVFYTPARNAQAVAELFLANVITFYRNTLAAVRWLQTGAWQKGAHDSYLQFKGNELAGKTIGIVGFGAIGHRIAGMVADFPAYVKYYDPYVKETLTNAVPVSLGEVFAGSDIVSIHLPANNETKGMINYSLISLMKKDAIFVNTSRAMVVNREDLLNALLNKTIRGAILDVFDAEPPDELDYKLIRLANVLATPHIAGATHEVEDHHARIMNENLLNWYVKDKKGESFIANRNDILL